MPSVGYGLISLLLGSEYATDAYVYPYCSLGKIRSKRSKSRLRLRPSLLHVLSTWKKETPSNIESIFQSRKRNARKLASSGRTLKVHSSDGFPKSNISKLKFLLHLHRLNPFLRLLCIQLSLCQGSSMDFLTRVLPLLPNRLLPLLITRHLLHRHQLIPDHKRYPIHSLQPIHIPRHLRHIHLPQPQPPHLKIHLPLPIPHQHHQHSMVHLHTHSHHTRNPPSPFLNNNRLHQPPLSLLLLPLPTMPSNRWLSLWRPSLLTW